jgi:hypothetical protein
MDTSDTVPRPGNVRLRLESHGRRSMLVVGLGTLGGAKRLAEDLIAEGSVRSVRVQHRNRGMWRPAWSWTVGGGRPMNPGYRITLDVVTALDPEAVRHVVQTGLQDVLEITRLLVGAPWQKHRPQLRRTSLGALEFREVERPAESDQ